MIIVNETELMANQKASTTIAPDVEFEALETSAGNSMLFSIGYDEDTKTNKFWCTYEVPGDTHGWTRIDLSSGLATGDFQGKTITPKSFDLGQDLSKGTIDLALAVTVDGKDWLYIASNVQDSNVAGITAALTQFKFDDGNNMQYAGNPINDVFVTRVNGYLFVFADINTLDATNTLTRYTVDQSNSIISAMTQGLISQAWIPHGMAMDAEAGAISNAIGCGPDDASTGGIYTLCNIANIPALQYTGLFNSNDPGGPAFPVNFQLPSDTDPTYRAIATSASAQAPYTDLFFATNTTVNGVPTGALYFIPYADQLTKDDNSKTPPQPVLPQFQQVLTNDLLYNIQSLHVDNWNDNIVLWGQSEYIDPVTQTKSSKLFVIEGVRGSETNAAAWSVPIPLLFGLENSATYINNTYSSHNSIDSEKGNAYGSCSVIFAHQADGKLVKLFQDPVTSAWQERYLLTEPVDATTVLYETTSYTSHIKITDDNNMVQPFIPVLIWSSSPCTVYVNEVYSQLEFTSPLQTTTDESGVVNIMQPVDTIGGIAFHVAVQDPDTKQWYTETINPFAATTANIKTQVPDGTNNHLNGSVKDEMGASTPLAPNANADQQLATSQNIYNMYTHADQANLNQDGLTTDQEAAGGWPAPGVSAVPSVQAAAAVQRPTAKAGRQAKYMRFNPATDKIWGTTFGKNAKHYEGVEALKELGLTVHADGSMSMAASSGQVLGSSNWFESKAGHLFKWMKSEAHKLENLVVQLGEDGLDCLMTIAGNIYHFVVKCVNDVVNAIHTALNAIATAFEDLVKWIGSIFAWSDFINTHNVIRNLFIQYSNYCIGNIDTAIAGITGFADSIVASIDDWAGFPDDSAQTQSKNNTQDSGHNKPQSNWANHHMKNNADNSVYDLVANDISDFISGMMACIEKEGEIIMTNGQKLSDIDLKSVSMADLLKQVAAMIADDLVQSVENIITTFLKLIGDLLEGIVDSLSTQTLDIPVISTLYKRYVGSPLTILDLICLVSAIPVTVIYKLANDANAPFEANDPLATAADYQSIANLCVDTTDVQAPETGLLGGYQWPKVNNRWYRLFLSGNVMALFGGIAIAALGYEKTKDSSSKKLAAFYALSYLPYIGPDIVGNIPGMIVKDTRSFSVTNGALAVAGVAKAFIDIAFVTTPPAADAPAVPGWFGNKAGLRGYGFISPFLDMVLNGAWEWPVVEAFTHSQKLVNDYIDLIANTLFNASGIISPLVAFNAYPSGLFWAGLQAILNAVYGLGSITESLDSQPIDTIST